MKKLSIHFLIIILFFIIYPSLGIVLEAADFSNLEEVLEIYSDSRKTRDLKESNDSTAKEAFMETLENEVYKAADSVVIAELSQLPEYNGKRIITHDFRTPGEAALNINTDRDLRVLVEVEPERWTELPVQKWENIYYREFARRTTDQAVDFVDRVELKKHADKYRQLPTDKFHREASRDFSDLDSLKVEGGEDYRVVSTPNVVKANKGLSTLEDPEGLAYMYREKADEQYRQAKDIKADLAERLKDGLISNQEIAELNDLEKMHEIEGTVQLKKGVETLEELRASYQKMGYDTGRLSSEMKEAAKLVKKIKGTSDTDIKSVKTEIKRLGFQDLNDLNQKLSGQLESLKLAKKNQKPPLKVDSSLKKAGKWAGIAGDIISIKDSLQKAEQGSHLLFNYEEDDSSTEKVAKTLAVAALELAPLPVISAVERGWEVDEEEKRYLQNMIKSGKTGSWETDPLTSMARVSTKITYRAVKSMTIEPLMAGKTAVEEAYLTLGDISQNFLLDFERSESERLQAEKRKEFEARSVNFDLAPLFAEKEDGRSLNNGVKPGEILRFYSSKNENWTEDYRIRWELEISAANSLTISETRADQANSETLIFELPVLEPGEYIMRMRVFDRNNNLQLDYRELSFTVSDEIALGQIRAALSDFGGKALNIQTAAEQPINQAEIGDILAFQVDRIGDWNENYYVEWLLNGLRYKYKKAADPKIHLLRFTTDELSAGNYKLSLRILDNADKIVDYRDYTFRLGSKSSEYSLNDFEIKAAINDYNGEPLNRSIENGEILAFEAAVEHPVFKEEITPLSRLKWQVYDSSNRALAGLIKVEDVVENGIVRDYRFRFRPENLSNGDYYVELEHTLLTKNIKNRARYDFKVYQPMKIDRLLVTTDPEDQTFKETILPDQSALFYVYYDLASEAGKIDLTINVKEQTGNIIDSVEVKRPREGEKAPYRIGYGLKPGTIAAGEKVIFEVVMRDNKGRIERGETSVLFAESNLISSSITNKKKELQTKSLDQEFFINEMWDALIDENGNTAKVRELLEAGADPNYTNSRYIDTYLHKAASSGYPDIIELLMSYGADINSRDEYSSTPLHYASSGGFHKDSEGFWLNSDSQEAIQSRKETIRILLDYSADINAQDIDGRTPLFDAVLYDNFETAKLLVSAGADPYIANDQGYTPIDSAYGQLKDINDELRSMEEDGYFGMGSDDESYQIAWELLLTEKEKIEEFISYLE